MAKSTFLERPTGLKVLGVGFLALMVFFVWVTAAFFNKTFVDSTQVSLKAPSAGSQLPSAADVKLRGMIVGEVREVRPDPDGGVVMTLAMKPEMMDSIPSGVTAQILPKTLFGEKFVSLIPPANPNGQKLKAGDVIAKAEVPIEFEAVLNDLYSLFDAVEPAELSYTLSAVSEALSGRGEQLGDTLVTLNNYLTEINPDLPLLVEDLTSLGEVADVYSAAMPDLGRLLENAVVTGNTIVAKQAQLSAFFTQTSELADTLSAFVARSGKDLAEVNALTTRPLSIVSEYSAAFPCFLDGLDAVVPRLNSIFRGNAVNINLELIGPADMPTAYAPDEDLSLSYDRLNSAEYADVVKPTCLDLEALAAGEDLYPQQNPYNFENTRIYELVGLTSDHNKYFADPRNRGGGFTPANRPAVASQSLNGVDTPEQRAALNRVVAASEQISGDLPDVASLLISPLVRGSEVKLSEAR